MNYDRIDNKAITLLCCFWRRSVGSHSRPPQGGFCFFRTDFFIQPVSGWSVAPRPIRLISASEHPGHAAAKATSSDLGERYFHPSYLRMAKVRGRPRSRARQIADLDCPRRPIVEELAKNRSGFYSSSAQNCATVVQELRKSCAVNSFPLILLCKPCINCFCGSNYQSGLSPFWDATAWYRRLIRLNRP